MAMTKPMAFIMATILLWQAISSVGIVNNALFPLPSDVSVAWLRWMLSGQLFSDAFESGWRLLTGLVIGTFFGSITGMIIGRSIFWEEALAPILHTVRAMPH